MNRAAQARGAAGVSVAEARRVYGRLLRYAKPYWRLYVVGLVGTGLFAFSDLLNVWFVKTFLQDAQALELHRAILEWLPLECWASFSSAAPAIISPTISRRAPAAT